MDYINTQSTLRILASDLKYQEAFKKEAQAWSQVRGYNPQNHPLREAYLNEVVTGNPTHSFFDWFAETYGSFDNCCTLGCGTGRIERQLIQRGVISKLSAIDASKEALQTFKNSTDIPLSAEVGDLNFILLPEQCYDLIIVWEALHHVINVEHLLIQIAQSLKPNGLFLVREFIGETRWQWSGKKRKTLNKVLTNVKQKLPNAPIRRMGHWPRYPLSPFESIRSGELVEQLHSIFGKSILFEHEWEAICHDALGVVDYQMVGNSLDQVVAALIEADRSQEFTDKSLQYCTLLALYGKPKKIILPSIDLWTKSEVTDRLNTIQYLPPKQQLLTLAKTAFYAVPGGRRIWSKASNWVKWI